VTDLYRAYRPWFYAAAVYNVVWGVAVVLWPVPALRALGVDSTAFAPFVQVIGMMVGVYSFAYYLLARDSARYCGLIWIALAGKTLGPAGFVCYAAAGTLPWSFGWTIIVNDVIWWPAFWRFALTHARHPLRRT
jgi:hypothetical protein